jgi:hypothetical protein
VQGGTVSDHKAVKVQVDENTFIYVDAVDVAGGESEVAGRVFDLEDVLASVRAVAQRVAESLKAISPDKCSVELGFEVKAEAGGLVALLVRSGGSASLKITLEWNRT